MPAELVYFVFFLVTLNYQDRVDGATTLQDCLERRAYYESELQDIPGEPAYLSPCQEIKLVPVVPVKSDGPKAELGVKTGSVC